MQGRQEVMVIKNGLTDCNSWHPYQWRIQDFPEGGGVNPPGGAWTRQIFPKTAWNRKNLDAQGGHASLTPPLDPPMLTQLLDQLMSTVADLIKFWKSVPPPLSNFYRPKRSFGQGNIFTPVCHSVHGGVPDQAPPQDQAGTLPRDQAGTPPRTRQVHPPRTRQVHPQDQAGTPPRGRHPPEQTPPGADTPRSRHPPGADIPPGADTPPQGPGRYTPREQTPPPRIRSTLGRYASYWNVFLSLCSCTSQQNLAK